MNALLCLVLLAAVPGEEFVQQLGDLEARLLLAIPEESLGPGRASVRVGIRLSGPMGLTLDGPRLEDAVAGWRALRRTSAWRREGGRDHIEIGLALEQVKPGVVPLPGVVVRARSGESSGWVEFSWPDLLHESRDAAAPVALPPLPASVWPAILRWVGVGLAALLALGWLGRAAWRRRAAPKEPPASVAALARLKGDALSADEHLALIDTVVREYLEQQCGVAATRRTGAEVLAGCAHLPEDVRIALTELLRRTELAKYAGGTVSEETRSEAIELAAHVIERGAVVPAAQDAAKAEFGKPGESR